ncbi:MAG TPA: ATP-binding protein, partial [Rhodocyclaceae bacterium]|nr:ATP-binding protein [Rhodocyclaceae bacterium]
KTLFYQEGRPDDPAGGQHETVAWVRRIPEYDWYLVASAQVDDLGRSGRYLSERLLIAFILGLIVTAGVAYAFIRRLTAPVLRLAEVARRNVAGDLAAVGDIGRRDEIGLLAAAFDSMVARLKEQIENLEDRVAERTRALSALTEELESRVEARMAEAKASEAKFRGLLEQSLAGIFVIRNDAFEYVNTRFAEMHGFANPAEIIGRYAFRHLVAPADLERVQTICRRFLEGRIKRCEMVFSGLHRDGSMVDLEVSARLIDYEGSPAMIGVVLDITERKKIQKVLADYQEQLEKMVATRTAQLEAANQQLQTFTYAASHDLKAPLRGIQSFSFLLEQNYREQLAGDGVFYLQHIQRSASRMGELIEDLLAHAKMEQQDLDIQPVDLPDAVRSALAERQEEIRHRQADIHVDLPPTTVVADRQGVAQALRNIVENALKYSDPATPPVIEIGARHGEGTCCLWVRDNGIGFDMAYHDRIFEVFRRLHTYDEYPGSGVGLALVKKAMERMGGRVWADSAPGQGTTFHLEFRLAGAPAADSAPSLGMACSPAAA